MNLLRLIRVIYFVIQPKWDCWPSTCRLSNVLHCPKLHKCSTYPGKPEGVEYCMLLICEQILSICSFFGLQFQVWCMLTTDSYFLLDLQCESAEQQVFEVCFWRRSRSWCVRKIYWSGSMWQTCNLFANKDASCEYAQWSWMEKQCT